MTYSKKDKANKRKREFYLKNISVMRRRAKEKWRRYLLRETPSKKIIRLKRQREIQKSFRDRHPEKSIQYREKAKLNPLFQLKVKEYYQKNKDILKKKSWINKLEKRYHLTLGQYEGMIKKQNGKCKICKKMEKLHIDHCHKTNKVRALLCMRCNAGLGSFSDDVKLLKRAINYINGSSS